VEEREEKWKNEMYINGSWRKQGGDAEPLAQHSSAT